MEVALKVIAEAIDQVFVLEQHAQVLQQVAIVQENRSVHVVKSVLHVLPKPCQQVLVLKENTFLVVVLYQLIKVGIRRLRSLERHINQLLSQFILEVPRIFETKYNLIETLQQLQLIMGAEIIQVLLIFDENLNQPLYKSIVILINKSLHLRQSQLLNKNRELGTIDILFALTNILVEIPCSHRMDFSHFFLGEYDHRLTTSVSVRRLRGIIFSQNSK